MKLSAMEKAEILIEALPYIKEFYGRKVVIKYGGAAMIDKELQAKVMQDIVLMRYVGMNPIVVHGGGPEINRLLKRLQIETHFVNGMRYTDQDTMEVVEMILGGKVNQQIVSGLNAGGGHAVGLSGKDAGLITARSMAADGSLGFVGEVEKVNPGVIDTLIQQEYIPVIAPLGMDEQGNAYNINADLAASAIASAVKADKLVLLTDVPGLLRDVHDESSRISQLHLKEIPGYIQDGVIAGGMIPKIACCEQAVRSGVGRTHIVDGRVPHSILLEIFTRAGVGTMVLPDTESDMEQE